MTDSLFERIEKVIDDHHREGNYCDCGNTATNGLTEALVAELERKVTTGKELADLPIGTVVHLDRIGTNFIAQRTTDGWSLPGDWSSVHPAGVILPATIIYLGKE